jgi:hypothetical protein
MHPVVYNSSKEYDLRQPTQQKTNEIDTTVPMPALFCCSTTK